jgi:hypothetical protein
MARRGRGVCVRAYVPHLRRPAEAVLERAPPRPRPRAPRVPVHVTAPPRGPAQLLRPVADGGGPGRLGRGRGRRRHEERQQQRRGARAARHGRHGALLRLAEQRRGRRQLIRAGRGLWRRGVGALSDWGRGYWAGGRLYIRGNGRGGSRGVSKFYCILFSFIPRCLTCVASQLVSCVH